MTQTATYSKNGSIGTIVMDDGKANAFSPAMINAVNQALNQAEQDEVVVILTGRKGRFSAGFDLSVMQQGPAAAAEMVRSGALLAERLLSFKRPVLVACSGHALAMGAVILASVDYRIGAQGDYKIGLNEVTIGMTMPWFGVEISRARLAASYLDRAVSNAEIFTPDCAVSAGFLDRVEPEDLLMDAANQMATQLCTLNAQAHFQTKLRVRHHALAAVRHAIEQDFKIQEAVNQDFD